MSNELVREVQTLRTEVGALVRGLLLQQDMLRVMDEKLTHLLEAATQEPGGESGADPLHDLLTRIVDGIGDLVEGQEEIRKVLGAHVH